MRCCVLMGVSGCGKTTIGESLAESDGISFIDGDNLHPVANIEKMASGQPLTDIDRAPWLEKVGQALAKPNCADTCIIGCSALKRSYRDIIRAHAGEEVAFLHLAAPKAVLLDRVQQRENHFMPAALLDSQYAALEALSDDEIGREFDIAQPLHAIIEQIQHYLKEIQS